MDQRDRTMSPPTNPQVSNTARSTGRSSLSPLRQRPLARAATFADNYHPLKLRRSSTFSDATQSIKSSTDDLLLPRAQSPELVNHERSHWHSIPLALALLPAAGGLFFENGSALITDLTLLGLAAVFLNWSVRLPWDWYQSAQSIKVQEDYIAKSYTSNTIIEEGSEEEEPSSQPTTPGRDQHHRSPTETSISGPSHSSAATELRIHELLALLTCFLAPFVAAWLLHHIRAQLSRPSEGLVSNYNLTIFLLASELRPLSHLIKLVQARTLHLQRTVTSNPRLSTPSQIPSSTVQDLLSRVSEVESHIANTSPTSPTSPTQPGPQTEIINAVRKSLQPDLDALNRAVRRYEKRATLLSLQTESRLSSLSSRMSDAITLAAAAERSSQSTKQRRGSGVVMVVDYLTTALLLPMQIAWALLSLPGQLLAAVVKRGEDFVGNKFKKEMRTAGRVGEKGRVSTRGQKKAM